MDLVDGKGIPLGTSSSPRPTVTTRRSWTRPSSRRLRAAREAARSGERASRPRLLRLEGYPREARGPRSERRDRREGQKPAPLQAAIRRWVVERTNSWHNAHKKLLAWCTERCGRVIDFWVAFSDVVIILSRLIREG